MPTWQLGSGVRTFQFDEILLGAHSHNTHNISQYYIIYYVHLCTMFLIVDV